MKKLITVLFLICLFYAQKIWAQPPVINLVTVDEIKGEIVVRGDFGWLKGYVFVDSISLPVTFWSDTICRATIPVNGKGSAGLVEIGARGYMSEGRMLTHIRVRGYSEQTQLKPYFTTEFIHEKSEAWHFRVDIESNILRRTKYVDMLSAKDSRKDTYDETIDDNNIKVERRDSSFIGSTTFTLIVFDKSIYYEGHLFTAQDSNYKAIGRSNRNFQQAHSHQDISEFGDWGSDFLPRKSYTDLTFLPLAFPSDSNYYGGEVPTLNWTTSKSVVKYEMQLSKDSLFQEIVIDSIVSLTPFNIPSITGGKYFWRVRVRNSVGEGMWSNVARLKYSLVNSVAADHTQFIKIFPNPASNNLIFSFFVNKPSNVTLKLYDIFEKEIATLIENKILSDTQSMEFSTTNIPTGTYHCRLQIGQAVYSQKVIVLH